MENSKGSLERSLRDVELIISQRGDQTKDGKMEPNLQEGALIPVAQNSIRQEFNSNSMVIYNGGSGSNEKSVSSKSPPEKIHLRNASIN